MRDKNILVRVMEENLRMHMVSRGKKVRTAYNFLGECFRGLLDIFQKISLWMHLGIVYSKEFSLVSTELMVWV